MNPDLFLADLEAKPRVLRSLAASLREADPWAGLGIGPSSHLVLLGMGSSHYANAVAAARLRHMGVNAVAELASNDLLPQTASNTVVIAVSASGGSAETVAAAGKYRGRAPIVAVTNAEASPLAALAEHTIAMGAGEEAGGVACRTFQHTLVLLLALQEHLSGGGSAKQASGLAERAADASQHLLETRQDWLEDLLALGAGPDGTAFVAPGRRMSSAQQSALMLREGPRRPAVGCETGDWSHVDVYLTKTTDYRLVLFPGSSWERELLRWVAERKSTLVAVGSADDDVRALAAFNVRYPHDDDDDVRLVTEVLVAELAAAQLWQQAGQ